MKAKGNEQSIVNGGRQKKKKKLSLFSLEVLA
jgi:hypothetical protein